MQRYLAGLAVAATMAVATPAAASQAQPTAKDRIGDLIQAIETAYASAVKAPELVLKATLYHTGARGVGVRDSLGCTVAPMRTLAVDPKVVPRRTLVFIKETVGMPLPDGGVHDGIWYASDVGGAIKGSRIDLFTGHGRASMQPFMSRGLNLRGLSVTKIGKFEGCPPT